jgi:hypothetical protein
MRLRTRLEKLERSRPVDRGCPGCRDRRGRHLLVNVTEFADGTVAYPDNDAPVPCAQCGVVPEFLIQIVTEVVESTAAAYPAEDCRG